MPPSLAPLPHVCPTHSRSYSPLWVLGPGSSREGGGGILGLGYPCVKVCRADRNVSKSSPPLTDQWGCRAPHLWLLTYFHVGVPASTHLSLFSSFRASGVTLPPSSPKLTERRSACFQSWGPGGSTCIQVGVWPSQSWGQRHSDGLEGRGETRGMSV